jgi:putative ABC transport system permease protein
VSLRNVAGLYLVRLRGRIGQELLAFAGIAVGVSLLFAALVANSSLTGSFERQTEGIVGSASYELAARGAGTITEGLLAQAEALPGVSNAAGILEAHGEVRGPAERASVLVLGVTPGLGDLGGSFTKGFSYGFLAGVRAVALPTPLAESLDVALAEPVTFILGDRKVTARLGAKLQFSDIGDSIHTPVAVAPLRFAQELMEKPGQVTRIFVQTRPGQEAAVAAELRQLAGDHADVHPADFDATLFRQAALPTSESTAMFSVFGAMVGFLFAFSAMLLTVPQRRRLIADLETEGYRPRTIFKVLLFDALALGVAASTLGIVLGDQVARRLFDGAPSFLEYAFPVGNSRIVEPRDVLIAAVGGIVASCVAVLGPTATNVLGWSTSDGSRRARADGVARIDWVRLAGIVVLAGGVAIVVFAPASAALGIAGLAALTAAMLLVLPTLLGFVIAAVEALTSRVVSVVPFIATFDLRDGTTRARSLAVAATGAVAVFGSVALQGAHADLQRGLDRTTADVIAMGDVWALPPGKANLLVTTPFAAPRIRAGDGIARIAVYRGGFLDIGSRRVSVFGPPTSGPMPISSTQVLDGDVDVARARLREGGWMLMSEGVAREQGVGVGDRLTLPTPVPTTLRIAALSTNMGWPPGAIILNADDYERAWGSADASALLATLSPGTTPAAGRRALAAALGNDSGLTVETAQARQRQQERSTRVALRRLAEIAALVLISAVIAMASAMAGLIWQRRAFLASVKVEGYSTSDMWKALLFEAGILIGVGCALGAAFGLLGQSLLSRALTSVTGFPVVYSLAAVTALLTCLAVTFAAVSIVALFGQRAASVAPESGLVG